ncbi:hypothetical protein ACRPOS_007130 [Bartonella heixiaziensis]|uniref:hypothetical protein n=1 Tax=Bartonella heixiaziensis TaxID=1461000 RepID=UPI0039089D75
MKRVVLAAALFSIVSSVLFPITASALPAGNAWGGDRKDKIVEQLVKRGGLVEDQRRILSEIVIPESIDLFSYRKDRFKVYFMDYPLLHLLGLGSGCKGLNPKEYSGHLWLSCSINGK